MENPTNSAGSGTSRPTSFRTASIGILTYRRPGALNRCVTEVLEALAEPLPASWAVVEVLVIDNDPASGAHSAVTALTAASPEITVHYVHEAIPGVAPARNRALAEAVGDVLVFIDDDEIPSTGWPHGLLTVLTETGAAMVGGPVLSAFTTSPPRWIIDGGFFDRDDPSHRSLQTWLRSGNMAIDLDQVNDVGLRFDPRYTEGEDSAFTRAARHAWLELRWSSEGAITEFVGDERFSPTWRLRRE